MARRTKRAVEVEGATGDVVADGAGDGEGFAGEHGLVDGAAAVEDEAVEGDAVAGENADEVVGLDGGEGEEGFGEGGVVGRGFVEPRSQRRDLGHPVCGKGQEAGVGGFELGEAAEGAGGAGAGAGFEPAAGEEEGEDEDDGFVVDVGGEAVAGEGCGRDGGGEGGGEGGEGAERDQGVHVGGAVARGAPGGGVDLGRGEEHGGEGERAEDPADGLGGEIHERRWA